MKNVKIEFANFDDINDILKILEQRCLWMEKNNIKQWESNSYTVTFDYKYFEEQIKHNKVYVAKIDKVVCGLFLLSDIDNLWSDSVDSLYIHHLATDMNYSGLGKIMIDKIKQIALQNNKSYIRLDCVRENKKLNKYYEKLGFVLKKSGIIGSYNYNLRELKLSQR